MIFYKLQATGNDFIILLNEKIAQENVSKLCNTHTGIGADGLISIDKNNNIEIYNNDGSFANMCGNGLRCVSKLLSTINNQDKNTVFIKNTPYDLLQINETLAKISMPNPMMLEYENGYYVTLANNHYVILTNSIDKFIFNNSLYEISNKRKCNIHIVEIVNKNEIKMKSYEYGVGFTNSCGSGSLAAFFCLYMLDKVNNHIKVSQPGGNVFCSYENNKYYICGEVKLIYKGELYGI